MTREITRYKNKRAKTKNQNNHQSRLSEVLMKKKLTVSRYALHIWSRKHKTLKERKKKKENSIKSVNDYKMKSNRLDSFAANVLAHRC